MPRFKVKRRTEARCTERQRRGSLADLAVEAVTLGRYQQRLWNFFLEDFHKPMPCTVWHLDDELSQYVEELWQLEMVLLRLNTLWLPCIISPHSCMGEFQALGKS